MDRIDPDKDEVLPADGTSAGYDVPVAATGARLPEDRGVGLITGGEFCDLAAGGQIVFT